MMQYQIGLGVLAAITPLAAALPNGLGATPAMGPAISLSSVFEGRLFDSKFIL